jgi:sulfate transport system permease protein
MSRRISPVIPGFGLTLGYTLVYLSLIVLIPWRRCSCTPLN